MLSALEGRTDMLVNPVTSEFDPSETWAAQGFCSAKASFVFSRRLCTLSHEATPTRVSHGNPHSTARIRMAAR
jgi:hypothetical protein